MRDVEPVIHGAAVAPGIQCELCDAGFRRIHGFHWGCRCPDLDPWVDFPCMRLFVVQAREARDDRSWMAYVDGGPLRLRGGDPRLFASANEAYNAALKAAPKIWHEHQNDKHVSYRRPPPRTGTATAIVLEILNVPRDFPWLTAQDIVRIAADRGVVIKPSTVAAALANLEIYDLVVVSRTRSPLRYRKGDGKLALSAPKTTHEMLRVLHEIKNNQGRVCGKLGTRQALIRRGLLNEIRDEQGNVRYEISATGLAVIAERKLYRE